MAIGIRIKLAGVTAEQFDKLQAAIDPDANRPDGLIFHSSGPVEGGWGVLDFWKSREHFDRFSEDRIGPGMAAAGIAGGPPEIHEFPVHEHFPASKRLPSRDTMAARATMSFLGPPTVAK